jgi:SAM-dependent methyltransferase
MSLYRRIVGHPIVYEYVRPLVVGGIDMSPAYTRLGVGREATVLDIGCGTGDALEHLGEFGSYLGLDTDAEAVSYAKTRHQARLNARFECRECTKADLVEYAPTHVSMIGLLHHLPDDVAVELLASLKQSARLSAAVTLDIVYLDGHHYNNLLARLDRGKHCRTRSAYIELAQRAGLTVRDTALVKSHPTRGLVDYFIMELAA